MEHLKSKLLEYLSRDDLLQATLLLGTIEKSSFCGDNYVEKVLSMASRIWDKGSLDSQDPLYLLEQINQVVFEQCGIQGRGERYKQIIDDPKQYYLHQVLDGHNGSSITLTVLFLTLMQQVGIRAESLSFPSVFLIRMPDLGKDTYVDAFDHGKIITQAEFQRRFRAGMTKYRLESGSIFEKVSNFQLVGRMIQHLKHVYILKGDALSALKAVEFLTALYPGSPELTRDRGILFCEMEYFSRAVVDLKTYLKKRPNAEDIAEIKKLASMLKGYRETIN